MIRNSRQASVSKRTREELLRAAEEAPPERRASFLALADEISQDLEEYEDIQKGKVNTFDVEGIDQLGECLVKARLAKGWTHRQLAAALQVSEQMVQRDEARLYEHAGLARIAEVADVLGYSFTGALQPSYLPVQMWRPFEMPDVMAVSIEFKATATWVNHAYPVLGNLTTDPTLSVQPVAYGSSLGPLFSFSMIGALPISAPASTIMGPIFSTDAFDSAATVPIQVAGGKP